MSIHIDIAVDRGDWPDVEKVASWAQSATTAVFRAVNFPDAESELSIMLTDDVAMRELNHRWREKDAATNVLSFSASDVKVDEMPGPMLGDIVLASETVKRESALEGKTFENHVTHLIVHGLLHLLGYDHENDTDAKEMENLETVVLGNLGIPDPYAPDQTDS